MRKLLLMLFVILFGGMQSVSSQSFKEGCQWSYYTWLQQWEDKSIRMTFEKYELKETFELDGRTYNRLYLTRVDEDGNAGEPEPLIGLREENGRVYVNYNEYMAAWGSSSDIDEMYYLKTEDGKEIILYDFTLGAGEWFGNMDVVDKMIVRSCDKMVMETGKKRSVYNMEMSWGDGSYGITWGRILEGIGAVDIRGGLLNWLDFRIFTPSIVDRKQLNVYVEGNALVYKAPEYAGDAEKEIESYTTYKKDPFFDNLITGISSVKSDAGRDVQPCLYDLSGRKVEGRPRAGVYIYNSKKVVIK
jgi:hypothetical protein